MSLRLLFTFFFCLQLLVERVSANEVVSNNQLSLSRAIDQALENNLGLLTSRTRPADALDDVEVAESVFDPDLFGSVSFSESQAAASGSTLDSASRPESESRSTRVGAEKLFSSGATVTASSNLNRRNSNNNALLSPDYSSNVGIDFSQPLISGAWSEINLAPIARARLQADQSLFELRSDILDVMLETELAYWNLAFAVENRALISSRIELAESLLEENTERRRLGLVTLLEVLQAETELLNQQEAAILADREIEEFQDVLRRVIGMESLMDHPKKSLQVASMPGDLPSPSTIEDVVREAIASDEEAKAQEKVIEVQRINQLLARDSTRINLDLTGSITYQGRDEDGYDAYSGAYAADGYAWDFGLALRFPWSFRGERAELRKAVRAVEREEIRLYEIKEEKALAARNAWRAADAGLKRIQVTRKALRLNKEAFEQERARFGEGLIAYRQLLEAQRDYDNARSSYLSARIQTLRAIVRLSRVDGTILMRNGFTWERLDRLSKNLEFDTHPIIGSSANN
ncbi:MAG: TolC family protein [Verrucomicrobiota bacterium]